MEEKESPKKEEALAVKASGLSPRLFGILKFLLGILILPFVYSTTKSFINEFSQLQSHTQIYFISGVVSFLIIYLFVWEPAAIYRRGQRFVEIIFRFFAPLVKVAPFVLPIYTLILFLLYLFVSPIYKSQDLINYFVFLLGFSLNLHLVFSAKSLKTRQSDYLRANYIFGFSFIYIINIFLLCFGLSLLFDKFSFVNFSNSTYQIATEIFKAIFRQLFL